MNRRPRILDLYCCEGGAAVGYHRAGFDVYGVDLFEDFTQGRYPFASHKGDAILALTRLLAGEAVAFTHRDGTVEWLTLADFDVIHASPPCQHASAGTRSLRQDGKEYPALIAPTRWLLQRTGLVYVIENVRGADLHEPVELCGCMFDLTALDDDGLPLRLERPRGFESNIPLVEPRSHHHDPDMWVAGSYGGSRRQGDTPAERRHNAKYVRKGGYVPSATVQQQLLGIDWMTQKGMHQSVPPAYCQWLGALLLEHLTIQEAAA